MMSEAIAFFGGLIAMTIVWFVHDVKYNPYTRGYADGFNEGAQEMSKKLSRMGGEENDEK